MSGGIDRNLVANRAFFQNRFGQFAHRFVALLSSASSIRPKVELCIRKLLASRLTAQVAPRTAIEFVNGPSDQAGVYRYSGVCNEAMAQHLTGYSPGVGQYVL